ncbi:MAG: hypothetical protein QNJ29_08720 [Rhizobiaceae bacterium]|nr:hypothetical protein [Rhizobiaceae bacterium]
MKISYMGMTVNERLVVSGLLDTYEQAINRRDFAKVAEILEKVEIGEGNIKAIIDKAAKKKPWSRGG